MNLLTHEQRTTLTQSLGYAATADADAVLRALTAIRYADRNRGDLAAVGRVLSGALSVLKRLIAVEAEYHVTRSTVARLVVANQRGDDYGLGDLAFELEQQQIDLKNDYAEADDLARAAEQEGLL